jgi:hypothetical protein
VGAGAVRGRSGSTLPSSAADRSRGRWGSSKTSGQGTFVVHHQTSYTVIGRYKTTITSSDPTRAHHRLLYWLISISVPAAVQRRRDLPHELHYWLLGGSHSSNW